MKYFSGIYRNIIYIFFQSLSIMFSLENIGLKGENGIIAWHLK